MNHNHVQSRLTNTIVYERAKVTVQQRQPRDGLMYSVEVVEEIELVVGGQAITLSEVTALQAIAALQTAVDWRRS